MEFQWISSNPSEYHRIKLDLRNQTGIFIGIQLGFNASDVLLKTMLSAGHPAKPKVPS